MHETNHSKVIYKINKNSWKHPWDGQNYVNFTYVSI